MAHFVLVPGAWLGAWAWDHVSAALNATGFAVTAITLSGLGDRRHVPVEQVGQSTHVADIISAIKRGNLRNVVLVGHSYSGVPVGQAAVQIRDRLRRVVFVDANIPRNGQAFIGGWSPRGQEMVRQQIADNAGCWPAPAAEDFTGQDLSDEAVTGLMAGSTPHPGRTLTEPAQLTESLADLPSTYIKCLMDGDGPTEDVKSLLCSDMWELREIETGHWPMFSKPDELAALLIAVARIP